jgi:hypothetical protein
MRKNMTVRYPSFVTKSIRMDFLFMSPQCMISTLKNLAALVTFYPPVIIIPHLSQAIHLDDVPIFVSFHIYQDFKTKIPELFSIDFSRNHLRLSKSSRPMALTNDE